jgi:hypothetical protein
MLPVIRVRESEYRNFDLWQTLQLDHLGLRLVKACSQHVRRLCQPQRFTHVISRVSHNPYPHFVCLTLNQKSLLLIGKVNIKETEYEVELGGVW